jgi:hypothetical protein
VWETGKKVYPGQLQQLLPVVRESVERKTEPEQQKERKCMSLLHFGTSFFIMVYFEKQINTMAGILL